MSTALVISEKFQDHATAYGHPECPERLPALWKGLESAGLLERLQILSPREASIAEITACHTPRYVTEVLETISSGVEELAGGDVTVCPVSGDVAQLAAGGVLQAVDAVITGVAGNAFCSVRPPGHHARPSSAMGFCLFNNVAIAAKYAQRKHGLTRVAIVDWDVHHGNGTQEIFYHDGTVLFFSTHQSPWYPGTGYADETGEGRGEGLTINRPLPAGSRKQILEAFRSDLLPALNQFRPELILISAGFDSRAGDPLGLFLLTDADFAEMTRMVADAAATHCRGRLVSVLEGGYSLPGLASAAAAHVRELLA